MLLLPCFLNMADMSKFPFLSTGNFYFGGITDWLKMPEIFAFLMYTVLLKWHTCIVAVVSIFIAH